jgi:hypothetical protein
MKDVMSMRTTLNLSEDIVKEVERVYQAGSRSKSVEMALLDAIRLNKLMAFMELKGVLEIDEETVKEFRESETYEDENHR